MRSTFAEAKDDERRLMQQKADAPKTVKSHALKITVKQFLGLWVGDARNEVTHAHLLNNKANIRNHIVPVAGDVKLCEYQPTHTVKIMARMKRRGLAAETRNHVFNILSKAFKDAVEDYKFIVESPILAKHRPRVTRDEAKFLNVVQAAALMREAKKNEQYGGAIRAQYFMGLRFGELAGLRVCDIDFDTQKYTVRQVWDRGAHEFRDYPKGRRQHTNYYPLELEAELKAHCRGKGAEDLVFTSPGRAVLHMRYYNAALKELCRCSGVPGVTSHGLRHSTAELMIKHGASIDEIQRFFDHKSRSTTERYVHGHDHKMSEISKRMSLENYAQDSANKVTDVPKCVPKSQNGLRVIQGGVE